MSAAGAEAIDALNRVLNEVLNVVQDVKQARWRVAKDHALRTALDALFDDLKMWSGLLVNEDELLGASPLASIPSAAGRTPENLWPGTASDEEIRRIVADHLDRLGQHVDAALASVEDGAARRVLATIEERLTIDRATLNEL
jgi:hypothetical protein